MRQKSEWEGSTENHAPLLGPSASGLGLLQHLSALRDSAGPQAGYFKWLAIEPGTTIIRAGQDFDSLLMVASGHVKTVFTDEGGNQQVVSFPVAGDLLGSDGIGNGRYVNDVTALSKVEVFIIPFTDLEALQSHDPGIVESLFQIISAQLVQEQLALTAMGAFCADARVARFLLKICHQTSEGEPAQTIHLWMTRQDIGNYLGMKIETVSRTLSHLGALGLIRVDQRHVEILDAGTLMNIASNGSHRQGPLLVRQRRSRTLGSCNDRTFPVNNRLERSYDSAGVQRRNLRPSPWSGLLDLYDRP